MARTLSLAIALVYLVAALIYGGWELLLIAAIVLIMPMAMIWFGDEIGDYVGGFHRIGKPYITKRSPGSLVSLFGWALLLAPVVIIVLRLVR
ncbi:hypothetical protein AMJ87_06100 [candidate division WOR_3 bacterium SM23_60]|uniref:Uncharacterized protein n=1 Tax=candidate division WOR_3 bacterium SM23_60 TaxID=1703780 RepID=A0A0S8GFZ2_UNCW3|nr:MAG: hypothetical protein AMJ87_06100 [candidate division WOR_3 bacterium SM23_60]